MWVRCLAVKGTNLFACGDGGVFLSSDSGTSWSSVNARLPNTEVSSLAAAGTNLYAGTRHFAGYTLAVFLSTDFGTDWVVYNEGLTDTRVRVLVASGMYLLAQNDSGGVFLSRDSGKSWTTASSGLTNTYVSCLAVSTSSDGTGGTNLFVGTGYDGVFVSTNNGTNWNAVNSGLANTRVLSLAVSGTNLIAGTEGGVFLSTNRGTSWSPVKSGPIGTYVNSLVVGGAYIFAGTYNAGVFLSTNSGVNWTAVNSGLPKDQNGILPHVMCFAVSGANLFAGTDGGVFCTTNDGVSWTAVNTGLTNTSVEALAVSGAYLFAGTDGAGVWCRHLSEMITSVEPVVTELPHEFFVQQNYPNPFNPSTTITYALPKSSEVKLSVFDMLGREVSVLVGESKDAGVHQVKFDGSNLASGVYFYRLKAGVFVATKRLLLLR
jgi:hypothetical protein